MGDHYTFLKDGNQIVFHRSDVLPNSNNYNNTSHGRNNHTFCSFEDNSVIQLINDIYNIENIKCLNKNKPICLLNSIFSNIIELDILRDIMTYPWNSKINKYANMIREATPVPPSSPITQGGNNVYLYNDKKYKINIGKKCGKYIIVNNKKKYIKKQSNSIDVISIKDPINAKIWWYTITWQLKNGKFNKINRSSKEMNGLSLKKYIKTLI